jgi:hypothetical protein
MEDDIDLIPYDFVCPECGVGNHRGVKNCLVCDKNLENTIFFMEDDSFDLEITPHCLVEYRKNFWGTRRTGKINIYNWDKMSEIEFGKPVNRFKFKYKGKQVVIPLREENMEKMKKLYKEYEDY